MVDSLTARYPGPVAAKEAQIVTPPPPCWRFIRGICAEMNMALCITSSLWSHLFKKHYYRSLVVCSHVTILFLERKGFLLATLTVVSGNLIFNILTEACLRWSSLSFTLFFFCTVWPWGEFPGTSSSGKIVALCKHTWMIQPAQTSAFIKVLTTADNELITCNWLADLAATNLFI